MLGDWLLAIGGEGSGVYKKPVVVAQRVGDDSSGRKMRLPSSVLTVAGSEGLLWRGRASQSPVVGLPCRWYQSDPREPIIKDEF